MIVVIVSSLVTIINVKYINRYKVYKNSVMIIIVLVILHPVSDGADKI